MADGGYLAPPSQDPSKETIWVETQKRLDRFLPQLFAEIFPPAREAPSEQMMPGEQPDTRDDGEGAIELGGREQQENTPNADSNDMARENSNEPEQA